MLFKVVLLAFAVIGFCNAQVTDVQLTPDVTTNATAPPAESTTAEPKTTPSPTTSTTTTTVPSTTSAVPTTTSAPITTSAAPITTTEIIPTTPAPIVDPDIGKWSFSYKNVTCIIVQMAVQLNVTYITKENETASTIYNVPINSSKVTKGFCSNVTNEIHIQWGDSYSLLHFALNDTTNKYMLSKWMLNISATAEFPNAKANQTIEFFHFGENFTTPTEMSYHCTRAQLLNLTTIDKTKTIGIATISHVQFEAFNHRKSDEFSIAKDCDAIDTPDIVPIAVGCALAALVAVVLVAYLVGRRRAQARGYLSM